MKGIAFWFLVTSVVAALAGMAYGIRMSITGDHTLSPAHGHLNLLGFVAMAVFGFYYVATPAAATGLLPKLHLAGGLFTTVVIFPAISLAILEKGETLAKVGSLVAIATMALFLVIVLKNGLGTAD